MNCPHRRGQTGRPQRWPRSLSGGHRSEVLLWHHPVQDALKCHRVTADLPAFEEVTVAQPAAVPNRHFMVAVFAVERHVQTINLHPMPLTRIPLGLLDFADKAGLHGLVPSLRMAGWWAFARTVKHKR